MTKNQDKIDFCVRYLVANGVDSSLFELLKDSLSRKECTSTFAIIQLNDDFFTQVAEGLRNMWPPGNKEGTSYAWRCPVTELVNRLKFIWMNNAVVEDYTVEDCLEAGRKYLAKFENSNTKYMRLLKYFVFKQKDLGTDKSGIYKKVYESPLLNMLQDKKDETLFDDFNELELI